MGSFLSSLSSVSPLFASLAVLSLPPLSLFSLISFLQLKHKYYYVSSNCNIPQAANKFLFGTEVKGQESWKTEGEERRRLGNVFVYYRYWMPVIVAADPDLVQIILAK